eukprot:7828159-Pyramimonas_sp.AAC.1
MRRIWPLGGRPHKVRRPPQRRFRWGLGHWRQACSSLAGVCWRRQCRDGGGSRTPGAFWRSQVVGGGGVPYRTAAVPEHVVHLLRPVLP